MSKPLVQSLWVGNRLSKVEQLSIKSFLDHGHEYHLYVYDAIENVPKGTVLCEADEVIPQHKVFQVKTGWGKGSFAAFADLFRFKLLLEKGGWWFDTDIICLKSLADIQHSLLIATSYEGEWGICANNCVMRGLAGDPLFQRLYDRANVADVDNIEFGHTGVHLLQGVAREMQLEKAFAPFTYFNPISWRDVGHYILGKATYKQAFKEALRPYFKPKTMQGKVMGNDSYTVHFWNEVWRQNNWDKDGDYPNNSLFEKLKRKHNII
ncbi:hypothetical protein BCY91_12240 [Pelobium manganitolerans]|uniref:Alpha 1,4-glycosyltransferase domain-containing protein n=1 Tax=Pelobium manganitolerans TaxID=1842495 RepID=A0A419S1R3_9SPHI|nr:glycosyltransferase [Pelobium manganitolerans]RKD12413.1 hypothetical protein BCY91_12240 [Pelobium manganitolerans]